MRGWDIENTGFQEGNFLAPYFLDLGSDLQQIWGENRPITDAYNAPFRLHLFFFVLKSKRLRVDWVETLGQISHSFAICKIVEGMGDISKSSFKFRLESKFWYTGTVGAWASRVNAFSRPFWGQF